MTRDAVTLLIVFLLCSLAKTCSLLGEVSSRRMELSPTQAFRSSAAPPRPRKSPVSTDKRQKFQQQAPAPTRLSEPFLITDADRSRIRIGGQRWITPGDYIVHEEYGIGQYIGIRLVDLTPARKSRTFEPSVVIKYADGEISWFQRLVEKELWLFRSSDSGDQELSSIVDRRKWKRRKSSAEETSKSMAMNLIKMMAIRNGFHRTPCVPDGEKYREFEERFQFDPTDDQSLCFKAISEDMVSNTRPMDRLVCGDVGFGKTEVAMRAVYRAVLSNKQVAVLAPTRVLALQHLRVIKNIMPEVNVQLLRGGGKGDASKVKEQLKNGECEVVIGTHALLQPTVTFGNLGLLVIDEEQRFGVVHKEKLKAVSSGTDVLTLSATPIPRTLQMSLTGLRDLSLMTTPPKGRKEVKVFVEMDREELIEEAIRNEINRQGQVFVVVPFVQSVGPTRQRLLNMMPGIRVIEAHGQHVDLEDRIDAFSAGQADVLVATTVIENGVDMPNVNTILVLNADRFGMSQLYQLRGRVGRSTRQAFAYFMTNTTSITIEAESRLTYLKTFTALGSGYDLARRDMEMRGHGTIFGADQSGAKDVGLDLQASILEKAVNALNKEFVLSIPDTRIAIGCDLQKLGESELKTPLPLMKDLSAVSRWEAKFASHLIDKWFVSGTKSHSKAKGKGEALRRFLASGTASELLTLHQDWEHLLNEVPPVLNRLLERGICRATCRRLGICEVRRRDGDAILISPGMDRKKWKDLSEAVPKALIDRVTFDIEEAPEELVPPANIVDDDGEPIDPTVAASAAVMSTWTRSVESVGVIRIKDAFSAGSDTSSLPTVILDVAVPLANYADLKLNEAVLACDPDREKADKKKGKKSKGAAAIEEEEDEVAAIETEEVEVDPTSSDE